MLHFELDDDVVINVTRAPGLGAMSVSADVELQRDHYEQDVPPHEAKDRSSIHVNLCSWGHDEAAAKANLAHAAGDTIAALLPVALNGADSETAIAEALAGAEWERNESPDREAYVAANRDSHREAARIALDAALSILQAKR